jgi:hypothetical protein
MLPFDDILFSFEIIFKFKRCGGCMFGILLSLIVVSQEGLTSWSSATRKTEAAFHRVSSKD